VGTKRKSGADPLARNAAAIEAEIAWFTQVMDLRFRIHGGEAEAGDPLALLPPPALPGDSFYARETEGLGPAERLVVILALLPHVRPHALDPLLIPNGQLARPFTEFGGVPPGSHVGFRPTRETALFLIAGEDLAQRLRASALFGPEGALERRAALLPRSDGAGEAGPWQALQLSPFWIARLTMGAEEAPRRGPDFPAQIVSTAYEWDDLVLPPPLAAELEALVAWMGAEERMMRDWGLARHLKPGYRALFHGPPGTGKSVTAALLGKRLDIPVYRVDLSQVVSKYIGETEKNLAALFDRTASGRAILFFDEADALFGKRGETQTANDRHANQQIAYLLQRIEDSPGLVILASNLKGNMDAAFARRFQANLYFPMPDAPARRRLWEAAFAGLAHLLAEDVDFERLARDHVLSGGEIVNVLRHCAILAAMRAGEAPIAAADLRHAIAREFANAGRVTP
jgi:hypothetical protein